MGKIVRMLSGDGAVVVSAIDSTDIVMKAHEYHGTYEVASAALGRTLTAASLIGYNLKNKTDTVTVRIDGKGPLGVITAVSDYSGNVRGYLGDPLVELPLNSKGKIDVGGGVGRDGTLTIIKDMGLKEPYSGSIPLVSGEIAEDITAYYAESEQIPTVTALGVLVDTDLSIKAAGGFILQLLPFTGEEIIKKVEENINGLPSVTKMMTDGMSPFDIASYLLRGMEPELLDEGEPQYKCTCSRERMLKVLSILPKGDIESLSEDEETKTECRFCNKNYVFTKAEIKKLLNDNKA